MNKNVCTEVVARNLCIGCGVCAGICLQGNLKSSSANTTLLRSAKVIVKNATYA